MLSHVFVLLPGLLEDGGKLLADDVQPNDGFLAVPSDPVVPRARALDDDVD